MAEYKTIQMQNLEDGFSTVLREASQQILNKNHINVIGEGYKELLSNQVAYENYASKLVEGFEPTDAENLKQLFNNNRISVIKENATSGIPPIASLAMPAITRVWAKLGIKNVFPTEVVKVPAFTIAFAQPYIIDPETNEKYMLPDALRDPKNTLGTGKHLDTKFYTLPLKDTDLLADVGCSATSGDTLDKKFLINEVKVSVKDTDGANPEEKTIKINSPLSLDRKLYAEISAAHSDGTVFNDTILGSVDLNTGKIKLVSLNSTEGMSVSFIGFVSSESHNRSTEAGLDITKRDFEIGTAEHFEYSLPLEFLTDTMALYNIDGASVASETLSNVVAQRLEQDLYNFLSNSQVVNPQYTGEFDVYPSSNYAINPQDWLEGLKRVIDFYANSMKTDSYFYQGYFAIIGNPVDTSILPNVTWSFNSTVDTVGGIDVNYSIGAMSGQNRYMIVSSDLVPKGDLIMAFFPSTPNYLTYKYFPYTFNVVNNYLNAQGKKTPNIMMTKRQTIEEFIPTICRIKIKNNDGRIAYQA